jgi:hypothetical protein
MTLNRGDDRVNLFIVLINFRAIDKHSLENIIFLIYTSGYITQNILFDNIANSDFLG